MLLRPTEIVLKFEADWLRGLGVNRDRSFVFALFFPLTFPEDFCVAGGPKGVVGRREAPALRSSEGERWGGS